jgi:hypothetical protein
MWFHNEDLHALFSSPNIVQVIKLKNEISRACSADRRGEMHVEGVDGEN